MTGLLQAETYRLLKRPMTRILLLVAIALTLLIYGALALAVLAGGQFETDAQALSDIETMLAFDSIPAFADDIAWQLIGVTGIILMASAVGNEFSWRTVLTMTSWTGDRVRFLLAKFIVVPVLAFIGVLVCFAVSILGSIGFLIAHGEAGTIVVDGGWLWALMRAIGTTWIAVVPYLLLAALLAIVGRGAVLGIALGLAVLFLEGIVILVLDLVGDAVAWVKYLLLNWNVQAVLAANGDVPGVTAATPAGLHSPWLGALLLAVFTAVFALFAIGQFVRRDLTE